MKQLTDINQTQELIKKSTFIAIVGPIKNENEAKVFLSKYSNFDATHNCWAYKCGEVYRFNDDGEPSGTAGMPILKAIENQSFDNTIALVIRHYGGVKLGTGGLMRAYGGSINRNLQCAEFEIIQEQIIIKVSIPFQFVQPLYNLTKKFKGTIVSENFLAQGVDLEIQLLKALKPRMIKNMTNITKGQVSIHNT